MLVKGKADINARDKDGNTALHSAADDDNTSNIKTLLKLGASTSVVNNQGKTPLQLAEAAGKQDVAELLRKAEKTK